MSRTDAALAGVLVLATVTVTLAVPAGPPYRPVDAAAVALAAAGPLALLWRQAAPLASLVAADAVVVVNAAAGYSIGYLPWPAWIALFTCFAAGGRRLRLAAAAVAVLGAAGYVTLDRVDSLAALPDIAMTSLVAVVAGELSRRRALAAAAGAREAAESRAQALAAERLLLQERGRLARELHDSLGHTVNVMVMQAGVGRRVFDDNPTFAREALGSIESAGRSALDELDRLLRVLQPLERRARAGPFAPTVADLEELADRIRATGRPVELHTDGGPLSAGAARALYRIVQEALTNAVRHTPSGPIRVEVSRVADRVLLDVTNEGRDLPDPVPGRGLVNMRERARLEGGELEAGPVEGGFRVHAVLPAGTGVPA
ncbi:sensor histidine kinase [Geodermatophilus saharensis]|uniref:sensor histidine kinase n=1 Tax=Geodermatophilus saharensis TaxID=1137994 RepID=UPI000B777E2D|nr:histidine kinase [Geodermatophilus saharensis]